MDYDYLLDNTLEDGVDGELLFFNKERWMSLPVLGDPDPADPTQTLPIVRYRLFYRHKKLAPDDRLAYIELEKDPVTGGVPDGRRYFFVFKLTKEATPGNAVVVLHEDKLAVRGYEPHDNGQVCLRSVDPKCPTWVLPAGEVNLQGVVIRLEVDYYDSGWA